MIKHVMKDGSVRDNIEGYVLSKELSEEILKIFVRKEGWDIGKDKTRAIRKK